MIIDHLGHLTTNRRRAFTLVEMMVVVGIIAILSAVVVPGIKKIYGDFKVRETYDKMDTIFSAIRAFRLIHNEQRMKSFLASPTLEYGDKRAMPFFPRNCVNPQPSTTMDPSIYCQGFDKQFAKFYKIQRVGIAIGARGNTIVLFYEKNDPYYLDDLKNRYKQKGCIIETEFPTRIDIRPPESTAFEWFQ